MGNNLAHLTHTAKSFRPPMTKLRGRVQGLLLAGLVVLLLMMIMRIYEAKVAQAPTNLKGNIATEGGMTANPPAGAPQ